MGIKVIATDIDDIALQMATQAAKEQNLFKDIQQDGSVPGGDNLFTTRKLDLTGDVNILDEINADLYVLSDVFESNHVAVGAARMTIKALECGSSVWVFAQSDRVQRETYRTELERHYNQIFKWNSMVDAEQLFQIGFQSDASDLQRLILWDLDEVTVEYN